MRQSKINIHNSDKVMCLLMGDMTPEKEMNLLKDLRARGEDFCQENHIRSQFVVFYHETLDIDLFVDIMTFKRNGFSVQVRNFEGLEFDLKDFYFNEFADFEMGLHFNFVDMKEK